MRFRALLPRVATSVVTATLAVTVTVAGASAAPAPAPDAALPELARRLATLSDAVQVADARLETAAARRDGITRALTDARDREGRAASVLAGLDATAARAATDLVTAKASVVNVVRRTYVDRASGAEFLGGLLDASDAADFSRRGELANRVGSHQQQEVHAFREARDRAARAAKDAKDARSRVEREVRRLEADLPAAQGDTSSAEHVAARARFDLDRWASVKDGPRTRIMGVSRLTAADLARWYDAQRQTARITVPMVDLTRAFIEEGDAAGVRGDLAFAQSLLETGSFSFPDYGQVHPADNNFAGIGACDSCTAGRGYPDARTGVRAQIQLLRAYADPTENVGNLGHPPVDPGLPGFFLKGSAPTWADLTGKWATSTTYGDSIFAVYLRILGWVTDHPDPRGTGAAGRE